MQLINIDRPAHFKLICLGSVLFVAFTLAVALTCKWAWREIGVLKR